MTYQSTRDLAEGMELDQINFPQSQGEGGEKKISGSFLIKNPRCPPSSN